VVTAQRHKVERGFGCLSNAIDKSCSDGKADVGRPSAAETLCDNAREDVSEDTLLGLELGGQVDASQVGGGPHSGPRMGEAVAATIV
jgi:hypothetical protein